MLGVYEKIKLKWILRKSDGREVVDWFHLAQDMDKNRVLQA
jgi:hypothetical protein